MLFFGLCFLTYFIKLSGKNGFYYMNLPKSKQKFELNWILKLERKILKMTIVITKSLMQNMPDLEKDWKNGETKNGTKQERMRI